MTGPRVVFTLAATLGILLVIALAENWGNGTGNGRRPAQPFTATTALSPTSVSFGDRLAARIDLVVDPRSVDLSGIEVQPRFGLYRIAGTALKRTHGGGGELLSYRYVLECLLPGCAPQSPQVVRRFPSVTVSYRGRDGLRVTRTVPWPSYQLASRVTENERQHPVANLRFDASLPTPTYHVAPGTLRGLSTGLAVLIALAAALLAWIALRPRAARGAAGQSTSRLEQALRAVRASTANGQPAERRKALGWLGRELRAVQRPSQADTARRLAWSADPPTPRSTGDFAAEVESKEGAE